MSYPAGARAGRSSRPEAVPELTASVELYWLPLGAGEPLGIVRRSGRVFEAFEARRQRRDVCDLYHSALRIRIGNDAFVIEMAPVWGNKEADRGVVAKVLWVPAGCDIRGSSATRSAAGVTASSPIRRTRSTVPRTFRPTASAPGGC